MTDTRYRALNSLRRHYGSSSTLQSDNDLLHWAATLTDTELLAWSNLGKRSLKWIRDHADGLPPEKLSLDAAWAEAEAALPEGWRIMELHRLPGPQNLWREWAATIVRFSRAVSVVHGSNNLVEGDAADTPAAALRALAAKLRER